MNLSRFSRSGIFAVSLFAAASGTHAETNWSRWRGPEQNGHSTETDLPIRWTDANIAWRTPLPGGGQSSPIIWGDRIFLTSALALGKERLVLCLDAKTGQIVWQQTAWKGDPEKSHIMNGWASASCVTDGEVVIAFFGIGGLHAYTVSGQPLWSKDLGKFAGPWGTAACPILVENNVVQNCDSDENAFLIALNKRTGKEAWRTKRRDYRGWSTPIYINAGGHREIVLNGHEGVQSYDALTGRELWFCKSAVGRGEPTITPAGEGLCVVNGLKGGEIYSVRPGGSGDVTDSRMLWRTPRRGARDTPSPIVVGDFLTVVDMDGTATCYSVADGHIYWKQRMEGKYSGSPIAAAGLAYFTNEDGKTMVLKPGPQFELVAENPITGGKNEIFRASPTPYNGQIFIRGTNTLYCIRK